MPLSPFSFFFSAVRRPPCSTLFPYTTLFRSHFSERGIAAHFSQRDLAGQLFERPQVGHQILALVADLRALDRKSTRLNSSHLGISYAVFCLKKKRLRKTHEGAVISCAQHDSS